MAVLAVFGRQWVTALATSSHAKSSVDLVMTHKTREELATKLLSPILDLLQPALVLSIGLFVAGLLFQAWNMAFQINPNSVVLMVSASSGTFLIVILGLVIGATLLHGIVNDNSPFRSPLTELVRRWRDQCDEDDTSHVPAHQTLLEESFSEHFLVSVQQTSEPAHIDALTPLIKSHFSFIPPKRFWPLVCGTMQHILRSGASTPAKLTIANHIPTLYSSRVLSDSPATEEDRRLAQFQVTSSWNFHEIIVELYMQAAEDGVEHRQYYLTGYVVSLCVGLEPILPRVLKTRSSVVDPSVCVRKLLHLAYWLRLDTKSNVSIDLVLLTEKLWSEILAVVKMECTRQCEDVERSRFVEIFEAVRPETFFDAWLIDNISIPGAEWSRQALEVITRRHSLLTLSILSKCLSNRRYETLEEDVLKLIMAVLHILRTTVDVESESRSAGDLDLSGLFEYLNDRPNRSHVSPFESVNSFDFAIVAVTNFLWELCTLSCLDKRAFSPLIDFLVRNCELYGGKNGRLSQRVVRLSVVVLVRMQGLCRQKMSRYASCSDEIIGQVIPFEDRGRRLSLPPIRTVRGTWSPLSSSPHGSSRNSPTTTLGSTIRNSKLITRIVNLASLGQSNDPEQQEPSPADVMISHLHALVCELPNNTPLGTFMQMAIMNMRPPQPRYGRGRRPGVSYLDEGRFQDRLIMCRQPSRRAFDLDTSELYHDCVPFDLF